MPDPFVVVIRLPDPAAYSWEERAYLRVQTADAIREVRSSAEPVGVDLVPTE